MMDMGRRWEVQGPASAIAMRGVRANHEKCRLDCVGKELAVGRVTAVWKKQAVKVIFLVFLLLLLLFAV